MKKRIRKKVIKKILESKGRFFSVLFLKRTDGTYRKMICKVNYDDIDNSLRNNLIPVIEITTGGPQFRRIPIEGIRVVSIDKNTF